MNKKIIIIIVLVLAVIPLLSGCVSVRVKGGGWIPVYEMPRVEQEGPMMGKATFGFTVEQFYEDSEYDVKGNLLYIDHVHGVRIKGNVQMAAYDSGVLSFTGEYTVDGETGHYMVMVTDEGEPGDMDTFSIEVDGGPYAGYSMHGVLGGGNIQILMVDPMPSMTPMP